ncbi:MAG: LysR family transcriptional regulator [Eggerthellaceae bacterium]|nr:LysR family transcriptional regulator [Eggerthellaceae bacterium]
MQTEYLEEFVTFARFMNLTKAAEDLHMTQSNLGKHIRKLETELGFKLVDYSHKRLRLTAAGERFLGGIQQQLEAIQHLVGDCQRLAATDAFQVSVQDPPFADHAARAFFSAINCMRTTNPNLSVKFVHINYRNHRRLLDTGKIDVLVEYRYGDRGQLLTEYERAGIAAVPLGSVPFCLWMDTAIAPAKGFVGRNDIADLRISTFSDESSPIHRLVDDLYGAAGLSPRLGIINANSPDEFYHTFHAGSAFLLPTTYQGNFLFADRADMAFVPFEDDFVRAEVFVITAREGRCAELFQACLAEGAA